MKSLQKFDRAILEVGNKYAIPVARIALFIVFFWFGFLKVIFLSPAAPLVASLQVKTLPFLGESTFLVLLGLAEMLIGLGFLFKSMTRLTILLLILHMITTFMPLVMLPEVAWQAPFVPTLEGQYIIKNLVLLALALQIGVHMKPLKRR